MSNNVSNPLVLSVAMTTAEIFLFPTVLYYLMATRILAQESNAIVYIVLSQLIGQQSYYWPIRAKNLPIVIDQNVIASQTLQINIGIKILNIKSSCEL